MAGAGRRGLPVAMSVAVLVLAWAFGMRAADAAGGGVASGTVMLPLLFAAAGLCVAGLLRRGSQPAAWLATVAATAIAALEIVGVIRGWELTANPTDVPRLVIAADGALLVSAGIAAAYAWAARAARPSAWWIGWRALVFAGLGVVAISAWGAISAALQSAAGAGPALAPGEISPLRASGRTALGFVLLATIGGALRDLAAPARRAWDRAPRLREFPRALGDELLPTAVAMRRRGMEDERARLAAELHARVLPDLRRAAEAAGTEPAAAGLRQAVEDVEQLMHARQSVVLEEYGLVAALEWLAERTEARTPLRVEVELDGSAVDDPAAIPSPVGRAAFRVALLAVDNVVRHAHARRAVLRLDATPDRVRLGIADDGDGFDGDAVGRSGRGLVDMRTAATDVGALVRVARLDGGTAVEFAWARAANPAAGPGDPTSSRSGSRG